MLRSWQSIQIACRLQESVREDTARGVLHVVRIEFTMRNHILVSWSVYPNYQYHYFNMYLVHIWLVEITCRLECISAAAKWSPGRHMRPIKRSGDTYNPNLALYIGHSHSALFDVVTPPLSCSFSYLYIGPSYPTPNAECWSLNVTFRAFRIFSIK